MTSAAYTIRALDADVADLLRAGATVVRTADSNPSLRAFDADAVMRGGRVVPGTELVAALDELFVDSSVATVHVHNAGPGCYAAQATRGADRTSRSARATSCR